MNRTTALASVLLLVCSGCANFTSPGRSTALEDGKSYWFDYDASRRGTLLVVAGTGPSEKNLRTCAEPAPDIAFTLTSKIESELKYKDLDAKAKGDVATQALKLADRTQMVMFIRETMYRLCEINMARPLDTLVLSQLYNKILDIALRLGSDKMIEYDLIVAEANLRNSEKELAAIQTRRTEVDREITKLAADLKDAQSKLEQAQKESKTGQDELQKKVQDLTKTLGDREAEVSTLKQRFEDVSSVKKNAVETLREKVTETGATATKMDTLTKAGQKLLQEVGTPEKPAANAGVTPQAPTPAPK